MTDKLNDKALLPCPFCGDTELSHGWSQPGVDGSEETGQVQCHSCDLLLWRPTEAEAIAAWNRRAPAALPEADGLEVGELVDRIAHKEQIGIWANEIAAAISLSDFLKDDWSFDDGVELEKEIVSQLRDILRSAFTHPEFDIYTALQSRDETIARLTAERDNALENYTRVWNERDAQRRRAMTAEARASRAEEVIVGAVEQMTRDAESLEGEFGNGKPIGKMIAAGEMPEAYRAAREFLEGGE